MFGRRRRIEEATAAVRDGYDRALTDAGVVLFQQVAAGVDGHYVSSSMATTLGWDATAFREPGTLRRLVHPDDLSTFRSIVPLDDATPDRADAMAAAEPTSTDAAIDLRGVAPSPLSGSAPTPTLDSDEHIVRFLTAAGTYRPMLVRIAPSGIDEPSRGSLVDASAGDAQRRRAKRLAEIADASHHGHLLFELADADDPSSVVFRSANDSACSLFDLDPGSVDGGRLDSVFDGPSARLLQSAIYDVAHTGESLRAERLSFAEVPGTFIDLRIDRLRDGSLGVTIDDVTISVEVEERLRFQANHDHLTGLANRAALEDRLSLLATGLDEGQHLAVVMVELDGIDLTNHQDGRHVGDRVLVEVGRRLSEEVPGVEIVARMGGDEFVVVSVAQPTRDGALGTVRLVQDVLERPLDVDGDLRHVSATIGAAVAPEHGVDPATLLRSADRALRHACSTADPVAVFDPEDERNTMRRVGLLTELRRGLANQELELRYQPVVDLRTGRVTKVESLLRWQRVGTGAQPSMELLEMAERSGLIEPLTRWIMGESARAAERLGRDREVMSVSTNLSMHNLRDDSLLNFLELLVTSGELVPSAVEVELAEIELTQDPEHAGHVVGRLRDIGLGVVIDDFGTGLMSIDVLQALSVTGLKIDRGYTTAIAAVPADAEAVKWAITMAHSMDISVTADGVADADSLRLLREMGCDMAQGLHLSEPVTFEALPQRVAELEDAMLGWVGSTAAALAAD